MVTMADVARQAGISISTVSHVINGTRFVREDTVAAVMQAIRETGYVHNTIARSLVTASTQTIGLAISAISNFYFADMIAAILNAAREAGYTLLLADTYDDPDEELRVVRALHQRRVDGLLLAPCTDADGAALKFLTELGVPTVLVDRCASERFHQVGTENVDATAALVDHLAGHGHSRIGLIAGRPSVRTSTERIDGYRLGLTQSNLPFDDKLVALGDSTADAAQAAVNDLIALPDPPTALVVTNNHMTIGVMRALTARGVKVPSDIALAVFDDFEWASLFSPRLTAIAQPIAQIGTEAVSMLTSLIADRRQEPRTLRLDPTFVLRESCGCPGEPGATA
ncbi:MAG TPA: LacI family transcriptional regulator [Micromonosporaceae bacterium]|nr:LacI family transcriptional regulator [Micromonosporaceae bacterium]